LARKVITRVRERKAFAHETLNHALHHAHLSAEDTATATRIAYGTIACRGTLDELLAGVLRRPQTTDPRVCDALVLAAWELFFTRTESYAVVDQGVELVRALGKDRQASLANALLRRLAASRSSFPFGDIRADAAAHARSQGHPLWLARYLRGRYGFAGADDIMATNNEAAPLYVAHLPFRTSFAEVLSQLESSGARPKAWPFGACIEIGKPSAAVSGTLLSERSLVVADACAQLAVELASVRNPRRIVEIGSGRGTKSLLFAATARRKGGMARVTGVDIHDFKSKILAADARSLHADEIDSLTGDATVAGTRALLLSRDSSPVDLVFVDAPCSGLGTLRRHPDKRWRLAPSDLHASAATVEQMLKQAAFLLRDGGILTYATCTISAEENEELVASFLASDAGRYFERLPIKALELPRPFGSSCTASGDFAALPVSGGPDGHFVSRLVCKAPLPVT
jgi:16S rRNA (cytosine967-C5)-methyltransferase